MGGIGSRGNMHRMQAKPQVLVVVGMVWGEDLERELAERKFVPRVVGAWVVRWYERRSSTAGNTQSSRNPAHYRYAGGSGNAQGF